MTAYGAIGAQIAIPPFLVISEATYPILLIFRSRCSFEKPNSEDKFFRTTSPSSKVTGLPPISINFIISAFAIVDLPEPENPVNNTVKPCFDLGGLDLRSSLTTEGNENHSGMSKPSESRRRSSVPDIFSIVTVSLSLISSKGSY